MAVKTGKGSFNEILKKREKFHSYVEVTQADRLIDKFGGARALTRALQEAGFDINPTSVYRWTYPRDKGGTGGVIPHHSLQQIIVAARNDGIFLTTEDLDPRPSKKRVETWIKKLEGSEE